MVYRILADVTLGLHLAFILFVALGGLLVLRHRWVAWIHLPTAMWGALISIIGWTCPLTPLENYFRQMGGQAGYNQSFLEHYVLSLIYPAGIPRAGFMALGVGVILANLVIYGWVYHRIGPGGGSNAPRTSPD
jgi:hypothetical protein